MEYSINIPQNKKKQELNIPGNIRNNKNHFFLNMDDPVIFQKYNMTRQFDLLLNIECSTTFKITYVGKKIVLGYEVFCNFSEVW